MRRRKRLIGCALFTLLTQAGVAYARPAHSRTPNGDANQSVLFDDDLLDAHLTTPLGDPIFSGHLRPAHGTLIRPRTSFVPELYESVVHI
jgi:hypothetical protein